MKKILLLIALIGMTLNAFAEKPLKQLSVALDWFPNPDHAPLIIAQQQGFFKEQGLEVKLINPTDPTDPTKWVIGQKADIAIAYQPEFMTQVDRGLPLIRIGNLIDKPLDCIVVLKDSGIKQLRDLKDKRIGTGSSGLSSIIIRKVLANAGLKDQDVELVNVRYNLTQALLSKKVDAVAGMMRNFEVPQLEAAGHPIKTFFPEDNGIPNYSVLIFVANAKNAKDVRFKPFLAAVKKAVAYLDEHPKETWQQFAAAYPESNNEVNRQAWFATMPYFAEDPVDLDSSEWKSFAQFMYQNKMIKKVQPFAKYAVVLR